MHFNFFICASCLCLCCLMCHFSIYRECEMYLDTPDGELEGRNMCWLRLYHKLMHNIAYTLLVGCILMLILTAQQCFSSASCLCCTSIWITDSRALKRNNYIGLHEFEMFFQTITKLSDRIICINTEIQGKQVVECVRFIWKNIPPDSASAN